MNKVQQVWEVIFLDVGVIEKEYRVATSEDELLMQLGRDGLDRVQILAFGRVSMLDEEQYALFSGKNE